ncbi:threonine/serine dehydratase [Legionella sp. 27cVA30]|uniref:threonine/serine dehydratase n=1 Tax=Legionella sp. 27cVA30 TaxID=2905657 RepID=UPI00209DC77F|nr:threonine/serine dehydratase [Legionella sp. 27cVA30]MCP0912971.1 threonine/serine dehydratase [Legionella sp. 27cVA30]
MLDIHSEVLHAEKRIRLSVRETPLDFSLPLSKITNLNLYLKHENLQHTGSFKVRGAFNALLSLTKTQKEKGVVVASTGNHGAAIAYSLSKLNIPGIIFVPENVSLTKVENIRNYNIPLKFHGTDSVETELYALDYAKHQGMSYISPYNHPQVIGGQGTIGLEILRQLDSVDVVFVPVGGGGLIAGIAGYIKAVSPKTKIIGCLPENSPVMSASIKAGKIISMTTLQTLSDATAGGIEPNSMTFDLCNTYVDDFILVSEREIQRAILAIIKTQHLLIEGAAAMAFAAILKCAEHYKDKNVVAVLSGANISLETLKCVIE